LKNSSPRQLSTNGRSFHSRLHSGRIASFQHNQHCFGGWGLARGEVLEMGVYFTGTGSAGNPQSVSPRLLGVRASLCVRARACFTVRVLGSVTASMYACPGGSRRRNESFSLASPTEAGPCTCIFWQALAASLLASGVEQQFLQLFIAGCWGLEVCIFGNRWQLFGNRCRKHNFYISFLATVVCFHEK